MCINISIIYTYINMNMCICVRPSSLVPCVVARIAEHSELAPTCLEQHPASGVHLEQWQPFSTKGPGANIGAGIDDQGLLSQQRLCQIPCLSGFWLQKPYLYWFVGQDSSTYLWTPGSIFGWTNSQRCYYGIVRTSTVLVLKAVVG